MPTLQHQTITTLSSPGFLFFSRFMCKFIGIQMIHSLARLTQRRAFSSRKYFRPSNPGPCHPRRRNHLNGLSGAENGCIAAVLLRRVLISQSINGTSVSLKTKWKEDPTLLQLCFIQPSRSARLCAFIAFKLNSDSHNRARRSIKDNF